MIFVDNDSFIFFCRLVGVVRRIMYVMRLGIVYVK